MTRTKHIPIVTELRRIQRLGYVLVALVGFVGAGLTGAMAVFLSHSILTAVLAFLALAWVVCGYIGLLKTYAMDGYPSVRRWTARLPYWRMPPTVEISVED